MVKRADSLPEEGVALAPGVHGGHDPPVAGRANAAVGALQAEEGDGLRAGVPNGNLTEWSNDYIVKGSNGQMAMRPAEHAG